MWEDEVVEGSLKLARNYYPTSWMKPSLNGERMQWKHGSRVRISPRLKYAELTIVSMYEELQVIRATEVTEEELKNLANELCNAVVDVDLQVSLAKRCQQANEPY